MKLDETSDPLNTQHEDKLELEEVLAPGALGLVVYRGKLGSLNVAVKRRIGSINWGEARQELRALR